MFPFSHHSPQYIFGATVHFSLNGVCKAPFRLIPEDSIKDFDPFTSFLVDGQPGCFYFLLF